MSSISSSLTSYIVTILNNNLSRLYCLKTSSAAYGNPAQIGDSESLTFLTNVK